MRFRAVFLLMLLSSLAVAPAATADEGVQALVPDCEPVVVSVTIDPTSIPPIKVNFWIRPECLLT
jgi:hypothetical protein